MYTQCPDCRSIYELDATTLAQAGGEVGCGECGATFDALASLVEALPGADTSALPQHPRSPIPPMLVRRAVPRAPTPEPVADTARNEPSAAQGRNETTALPDEPDATADAAVAATIEDTPDDSPPESVTSDDDDMQAAAIIEVELGNGSDSAIAGERGADYATDTNEDEPEREPVTIEEHAPAAGDEETVPSDEDEVEPPAPLPSFVHTPQAPRTTRHRGALVVACLVLALVLGAQVVWAERAPLAANSTTRPWLATACSWFGCTLPPVKDLATLELLSRDVRPHPTVPGALLISATLRNDAAFTQPYPVISITLSDLDENRIAMRRFRPDEYIADPTVRGAGLAPGATASLVFEVKDPGRNAVAFRFGFQ